ncbi:hypothetical protein AVEN_75684-1 [Araneus ventricosus]|uniref:Uncharacterized protein n=1 Tax=Araneus ventricosus TaxID=182803 RepID=A0A4Y2D4P3_ARAVE|nr:hypothetical protein AVEN_75684-1 [Araneus ventricosus]
MLRRPCTGSCSSWIQLNTLEKNIFSLSWDSEILPPFLNGPAPTCSQKSPFRNSFPASSTMIQPEEQIATRLNQSMEKEREFGARIGSTEERRKKSFSQCVTKERDNRRVNRVETVDIPEARKYIK